MKNRRKGNLLGPVQAAKTMADCLRPRGLELIDANRGGSSSKLLPGSVRYFDLRILGGKFAGMDGQGYEN
jgi:hypothetical protein